MSDYEVVDDLGEGAYGHVKLVRRKGDSDRTKYVLKSIFKNKILIESWQKDSKLGLVPSEIKILNFLHYNSHPNLVDMTRFFEDRDYYYVEMKLHGYGMDLFDYIEIHTGMSEMELKHIFYQVLQAICHLHKHGIVHRDIKDENIILDQYCNIKLIDFGSSSYVKPGKPFKSFCGTLDYAAPEIMSGKFYTGPPQDVWALGVLLYTLIYKENPF
ncbi:serine/threonine protein kinase, partial [Rozella allomycis CSF55]